ncbi:hypothetical protein BKI52_10040 [marine bacterium AO1-C]|nr:hypothetical protein BKI52_10040 [marine bacterium AO1-C]
MIKCICINILLVLSLVAGQAQNDNLLSKHKLKMLTKRFKWTHSLKKSLKKLDQAYAFVFHDAEAQQLPVEVSRLKKLQYFELGYCKKLHLGQAFKVLARLPRLRFIELNLYDNPYRIPSSLGEIQYLTALEIQGKSQLHSFPISCKNLQNLKLLSVLVSKSVHFDSLARVIYTIPQLERVRFENCKKFEISDGSLTLLGRMRSLKSLTLRGCHLTELPKDISSLVNLTLLSFVDNHLKTIPRDIGKLKQLFGLSLSSNQLAQLPREIGDLSSLNILILSDNQLTTLPKEIAKLKQLKNLMLGGNPISEQEKTRLKKLLPNTIIHF